METVLPNSDSITNVPLSYEELGGATFGRTQFVVPAPLQRWRGLPPKRKLQGEAARTAGECVLAALGGISSPVAQRKKLVSEVLQCISNIETYRAGRLAAAYSYMPKRRKPSIGVSDVTLLFGAPIALKDVVHSLCSYSILFRLWKEGFALTEGDEVLLELLHELVAHKGLTDLVVPARLHSSCGEEKAWAERCLKRLHSTAPDRERFERLIRTALETRELDWEEFKASSARIFRFRRNA